jgi:hypothetical protein
VGNADTHRFVSRLLMSLAAGRAGTASNIEDDPAIIR